MAYSHTPYIDGTVLGTGPNGKILGPKNGSFPVVGNIDLHIIYDMYIYIYIYSKPPPTFGPQVPMNHEGFQP